MIKARLSYSLVIGFPVLLNLEGIFKYEPAWIDYIDMPAKLMMQVNFLARACSLPWEFLNVLCLKRVPKQAKPNKTLSIVNRTVDSIRCIIMV